MILITDGKSQDNVNEPAQKLRSQGVHVFAVGVCFIWSISSVIQNNLELYQSFRWSALFSLTTILFLTGIKSADRNELAQISSQPTSDFTFFVGDFKVLNTLLPLVNSQVCSKAGGDYASDGIFNIRIQRN